MQQVDTVGMIGAILQQAAYCVIVQENMAVHTQYELTPRLGKYTFLDRGAFVLCCGDVTNLAGLLAKLTDRLTVAGIRVVVNDHYFDVRQGCAMVQYDRHNGEIDSIKIIVSRHSNREFWRRGRRVGLCSRENRGYCRCQSISLSPFDQS